MTENDVQKLPVRRNRQTLIMALASGMTKREAARLSGYSERTVFRYLKDPAFCREVRGIRTAMVAQVAGQMARLAMEAVEVLEDLLHSPRDSVRLGALRLLLRFGPQWQETSDLAQEITELREALGLTEE